MRRLLRTPPRAAPPLLAVLLLVVAGALLDRSPPGVPVARAEDGGGGYAGRASCASCHPAAHEAWSFASHAKTFERAAPDNMPEDVREQRTVEHAPGGTRFRSLDVGGETAYFAETVGPDGTTHAYPLTHVVGRMRVRMFVTTLEDGRLQVLPGMLDVPHDEWFDYTHLIFGAGGDPDAPPVIAPGDPTFWTGPVRAFDARCSRCHVSGRSVTQPEPEGRPALSRWRALGVDCEMCHGPCEDHVEFHGSGAGTDDVLLLRTLDREPLLQLCLRCHMEAEVIDPDLPPGLTDLFERVDPTLLDDPERVDAYGRPRELIYDGIPFLASRCAEEGQLTCISCHDPHGTSERSQMLAPPTSDRLCAECHESITSNPSAHSGHSPEGASCVGCHMPFLVIERGHGVVADHTIGIPRLDLPGDRPAMDACTWCHTGGREAPADVPALDAEALAEGYAKWWPEPTPPPAWQQALAIGRATEDAAALEALTTLLRDEAAPRVYRATAARLFARHGEAARALLLEAAADEDSLVRREAMEGLGSLEGPEIDAALLAGLDDPSLPVRVRAARASLTPWTRFQENEALAARAIPILAADAERVPDDDRRWFRLGAALELSGDLRGAVEAYGRKVAQDPFAGTLERYLDTLRAKIRAEDD